MSRSLLCGCAVHGLALDANATEQPWDLSALRVAASGVSAGLHSIETSWMIVSTVGYSMGVQLCKRSYERLFQLLRSRGSVDCGCGKVKCVQLVEAEKEDGYVVDRLSMLRRVKRQL